MVPKQRGGARNMKVTQLHKDVMLRYIEADLLITLETIKQNLLRDKSIYVSTTTIHNHLECNTIHNHQRMQYNLPFTTINHEFR
jgi:hypothetical protein